ncbi:MAG TPA: replicative DNA helicase [Burkholderiales bacterium]|nr:replicative DNA helicase [Burkholderiales bacterium]
MAPVIAPPQSVEAEQSLLGALLLDNQAFDRVADLVAGEDFYRDDHRRIWRHIAKLIEAGRPADVVTVAESIEASEDKDRAGGPAYLAALAQNTPSALNIRRYAELVRDKAILRNLFANAQEIMNACMAGGQEPREIAQQAETMILSVRDSEYPNEVDLPALLMKAVDRVDEARRNGAPRGLRTGLRDLDSKLGGMAPGLYVLAARPSVGKTALALNIAEQVAARQPVAFFSLEMDREELGHRLLANAGGIPLDAIRSGALDECGVNLLAEVAVQIGQRRLLIDDRAGIGVGYIRACCRRWKRRHGVLALVIVDYLQLMRGTGDTREQEVASISRGLKALAKELHVPVIALCQLNRALEGRTDKRPHLYDLRESGAIEQDADVVLMLYREDLHGEDTPNRGLCQVLVRKHRNGPLGDVTLRYVPELCRFETTAERFAAGVAPIRPVGGFRATRPDTDVKMRLAGDDPQKGAT